MGAVVDRISLKLSGDASELASVKNYLKVDDTTDDYLVTGMIADAKRVADAFLNNPFETVSPKVVFSSVSAGDTITVDGVSYEAATATDADEREFECGVSDSDDADAFVALVNSSVVGGSYQIGVPGVTATNSSGTVTFTKRNANATDPVVTSSTDVRLKVQNTRTEDDIPDEVIRWCFHYIKRHYENRAGEVASKVDGLGSVTWANPGVGSSGIGEDFSGIAHLRLNPGI